jgi:hypothetical protein
MTVHQITVPYLPGYDFGVGADLASGSPMGKVVDGAATTVQQASGSTVNFQVQRIHSTSELEQTLGVDVQASYGCGSFGASVSARFSFAKNSKVQSSSLFMAVTAQVDLAFLSIDEPVLTANAAGVVDKPDIFATRFGNMFVRGMSRGGLFVGVLRVDTASTEESEQISAELQGSYGVFSADAKTKFESVAKNYHSEVFVQMHHEGGPTDLQITDPTDPLQLLDNANRFLQSFQTSPDVIALPYLVTLDPVTIAQGPIPPNAADIEHAQDVIVFCASRRSVLLDQLNLLEYVADNSGKFDWSGVDASAVRAAAQATQSDLDLIARCASRAMSSPSTAILPADLAVQEGTDFGQAALPNPMPVPKAGTTVTVPDLTSAATWPDCQATLVAAGLTPVLQEAPLPPGPFKVLSVVPPAGTAVAQGSTVTITTNPVAGPNLNDLKMRIFAGIPVAGHA